MARPFGCVIDGFTRESLSIRVARKLKATATDVGEKVTRPAVIFAKMARTICKLGRVSATAA